MNAVSYTHLKRFEKLPLGVIQDKGTGTVKKLFVDDVDSLEVLLAHSMPEDVYKRQTRSLTAGLCRVVGAAI